MENEEIVYTVDWKWTVEVHGFPPDKIRDLKRNIEEMKQNARNAFRLLHYISPWCDNNFDKSVWTVCYTL